MNLEKNHRSDFSEKENLVIPIEAAEKEINADDFAAEKIGILELRKKSITNYDYKGAIAAFKNSIKLSDQTVQALVKSFDLEAHMYTIAEKAQSLFEHARDRLIGPPPTPEHPVNSDEYAEIETKLQTRGCEEIKELGAGSRKPKYIKLLNDGAAIYKSFEDFGKIAKEKIMQEKAAYLVSKYLNLDIVPPTIVREINGALGSCQEFIPDAKTAAEFGRDGFQGSEKAKLDVLDFLIQNTDRHDSNILIKNGRIIAIDHDCCFNTDLNKILDASVPQQFSRKLPANLVDNIAFIFSNKGRLDTLRAELCEILGEDIGNAYMDRFYAFANSIDKNGKLSPEKFKFAISAKLQY